MTVTQTLLSNFNNCKAHQFKNAWGVLSESDGRKNADDL